MKTTLYSTDSLALSDIKTAWDWYVETFTEVQQLAVLQHMLSEQQFTLDCCNTSITKHMVIDETGTLVGMAMVTNDLDAQHCIAPQYFARHYPNLYERDAVWYVIFVGASPLAGNPAFAQILAALRVPVAAARGLCIVDFCTHNEEQRRLPRATTAVMKRLAGDGETAQVVRLDQQSFWAVDPTGDVIL